jgi:hypothetical protein
MAFAGNHLLGRQSSEPFSVLVESVLQGAQSWFRFRVRGVENLLAKFANTIFQSAGGHNGIECYSFPEGVDRVNRVYPPGCTSVGLQEFAAGGFFIFSAFIHHMLRSAGCSLQV